jgi:hypothetical protein
MLPGDVQELGQLVGIKQHHAVDIERRSLPAQQSDCNTPDDDPTIAELAEDSLNGFDAIE